MSRLFGDLGGLDSVVLNTLACHLFGFGFKSGARHSEVYSGLTSITKTCPCNIQIFLKL